MSRGGFEYKNKVLGSPNSPLRRSPPPNPSSPPPPLPQEPQTPKSPGWTQTATSPIGLLEESGEISPYRGSPGSEHSVNLAVQRPVAHRLEHVHTNVHQAMSAVVYDDNNDWESVYSAKTPNTHHRDSQARFEVDLKDEDYPESSYGPSEEEEELDKLYEQHMRSLGSEGSLFPPPSQENQRIQSFRQPHQKHQQNPSHETQYDEYTNDDNQFNGSQFIDDAPPQHHWRGQNHDLFPHHQSSQAHSTGQYDEYTNDDNQFDDAQFIDNPPQHHWHNQHHDHHHKAHQSHSQSHSGQYDEYTNDDNHYDDSHFIDNAPQNHWPSQHHSQPSQSHSQGQYDEYTNKDNQFDDSQFVNTRHRSFRHSRHSSAGFMEPDRDSRFPDQFQYVEPTNIQLSQENDPNAVYYPAPVPAQLKLPPILSHRNQHRSQLPTRKPRPKSMLKMGVPLQQEWEPSPIDHEIAFQHEDESDIDSLLVESDASSYATRNSDDDSSYQEAYGSDDDYGLRRPPRRSHKARAAAKKEGWLSSTLHAIIGKSGDQDSKDKELVAEQEDVRDDFDATAFMKYDPDLVRQEAKRFEAGGVYSGTQAGKKPTSLIEELEIRKQGRARQRKGIVRDAMAAQQQLATQNKFAHPLDKAQQPTLLQLQQVANVDYNERKRWHQEATVRQKQDRGDESLAQRRARRRAARMPQGVTQEPPATETLAERRARIKDEKQRRSGLIVQHNVSDSPTFGSPVPDVDTPLTPAIGTA